MTKPHSFRSDFLQVINQRGFLHQATDLEALDDHLAVGQRRAYVGYDMTAKSLHIGNLITLMMLRWFQKTGHQPILLTGTATSKVGDPTDKAQQRPLLTDEQVAVNKNHIKTVFNRLVSYQDPRRAIEVDNSDWLGQVGYIEFLRRYGTHFTINRMLSLDSVKLRLDREQPMTFLEFNYMLMQSVDFLELQRDYGCTLQMGGSDQWGNIVNGVELTRRLASVQVFGLTTPLLMTASGVKMGKTVGGAVWLNKEQFSPYEYWQFWRNAEDADVVKFLKIFTELPLHEIARLGALGGVEINEAKKILADEATTLIHGAEAARTARDAARSAFENKESLSKELPTLDVPKAELDAGIILANLLTRAGMTASNSEARRLAQGRGIRLNDVVVEDGQTLVTGADCNQDGVLKLSLGKKRIVVVRPI